MKEDNCCEVGLCERDAEHTFRNYLGEEASVCTTCAQFYFQSEYRERMGLHVADDWPDCDTSIPDFDEVEMLAEAEYEARMDYLRDMAEVG